MIKDWSTCFTVSIPIIARVNPRSGECGGVQTGHRGKFTLAVRNMDESILFLQILSVPISDVHVNYYILEVQVPFSLYSRHLCCYVYPSQLLRCGFELAFSKLGNVPEVMRTFEDPGDLM